jgi:hypothetical protein
MNRIMATRLTLAVAMAIGLAFPASAQQPASKRFDFACKIDLRNEIAGVPATFQRIFTTFDSEKLCPGNVASENFKIDCFDELPGWPAGVSVNDNDFTCKISGTACGVPGTFTSTTESMKIQPKTTPAGVVGAVTMTCHFN